MFVCPQTEDWPYTSNADTIAWYKISRGNVLIAIASNFRIKIMSLH